MYCSIGIGLAQAGYAYYGRGSNCAACVTTVGIGVATLATGKTIRESGMFFADFIGAVSSGYAQSGPVPVDLESIPMVELAGRYHTRPAAFGLFLVGAVVVAAMVLLKQFS